MGDPAHFGSQVDETGLLGFVPGMDGVVVAVGFSGHGFKTALTGLGSRAGRKVPTQDRTV